MKNVEFIIKTAAKALLKRLHEQHGVEMFVDLHGHSVKKNNFIYGYEGGPAGHEVSFQWKNPDFLFRNPDFLLKKVELMLKCRYGSFRFDWVQITSTLLIHTNYVYIITTLTSG